MPRRYQLSRKKGWRKPPGAVNCARPGVFGNPFRAQRYGRARAVELFSAWLQGALPPSAEAPAERRDRILRRLPELRGKDLMCWCPLDGPCHCDVYLDIANR